MKRLRHVQLIKQHPFFKGIKWSNLFKGEPFVKPIRQKQDLTPMFKDNVNWVHQILLEGGQDKSVEAGSLQNDQFAGFSYKNQGLFQADGLGEE